MGDGYRQTTLTHGYRRAMERMMSFKRHVLRYAAFLVIALHLHLSASAESRLQCER